MRSEFISGFAHNCSPSSRKLPDAAFSKYLLNENFYLKTSAFQRSLPAIKEMNYETQHDLSVEYSLTDASTDILSSKQRKTTKQIKSLTTKDHT